MPVLNWKVSKSEMTTINEISRRAVAMAQELGHDIPIMDFHMDITACHANGCPLKLSELASAPQFDFAHDVFGIRRHINRETGQLEDCFLPRYSA